MSGIAAARLKQERKDWRRDPDRPFVSGDTASSEGQRACFFGRLFIAVRSLTDHLLAVFSISYICIRVLHLVLRGLLLPDCGVESTSNYRVSSVGLASSCRSRFQDTEYNIHNRDLTTSRFWL